MLEYVRIKGHNVCNLLSSSSKRKNNKANGVNVKISGLGGGDLGMFVLFCCQRMVAPSGD